MGRGEERRLFVLVVHRLLFHHPLSLPPQAYWPFHRSACRPNDFADAVEAEDPRFSAWLRRHGRQAALRDGEVERLEAAAGAATRELGARGALLSSMYGRADPGPVPPSYTPAEVAAVAAREAEEGRQAAVLAVEDRAWLNASAPPSPAAAATGRSVPPCGPTPHHVWWQTPVSVTAVVRLPAGWTGREVCVTFGRGAVVVTATPARGGATTLSLRGATCRDVAPDACTWTACDGVLTLSLVKASRRGRYADGETAADTWWRAVWREGGGVIAAASADATGPSIVAAAAPLLLPATPAVEYYGLADEREAEDGGVRVRRRR